jgi:predicted transcriptional regulator
MIITYCKTSCFKYQIKKLNVVYAENPLSEIVTILKRLEKLFFIDLDPSSTLSLDFLTDENIK